MADGEWPALPFGRTGPDAVASPQAAYRLLRETAPTSRIPGIGVLVTRYGDVTAALRDYEVFSSVGAVEIGNVRPLIPLQRDPPEHAKYRRLLDPLFSPSAVAALEDDVRELVGELVDGFAESGECEFHAQFAVPLPCTVFLRLLGLPLDELDSFLDVKDRIIRPGFEADAERAAVVQREAGQWIYAFFGEVVARRRVEPGDDLVSQLVSAEVDGDHLRDDEILDICFLFLIAGLDTVTASLGCSVAYLATHPERRDELVHDPSLVPGAVEELLRWETPVPGVPRLATTDVELGGEKIEAGETVMVLLGSADVDPSEFDEPDRVDFQRAPNRHLAFGGGVHRCLGSHLARLELRVALEELHRRIPDYRLKPGEAPRYTFGIRSVEYLPLVFGPRA